MHGPGVAVRLNGIRRRLGLPQLPHHVQERLGETLDEVLRLAELSLEDALASPST